MSRPPDRDHDRHALLADVLAEAEPAAFRSALLGDTLRLARRRRRTRLAVRVGAAAAGCAVAGFFAWRGAGPAPVATPAAPHARVSTYPLSSDAIVRTRSLDAAQQVATVATLVPVRTPAAIPDLRRIGDAELLALAAPRPVALVRVGPQAQELIFTDGAETPGALR